MLGRRRADVATALKICRYLGLAGSVALAAGGYRAGARPGRAETDALAIRAEAGAVLLCLAGLIALTVAWWFAGAVTARPGAAPLPGRWVLTTAVLWAAPLLVAPPLASRDVFAYACQGALIQAGGDPHQAGVASLPCPWLDSVPPVWRDTPSPYGPLFGLLSAGVVAGSAGHLSVAVAGFRALAVAGVLLAAGCGRVLANACGVSPARAGWLALASPLVALHAVAGAHNDALMAGLVLAAFAVAVGTRSGPAQLRPVSAGVLLGLAVSVKITALVALPFLALLLARTPAAERTPAGDRASGRDLVQSAAMASGALVVTYAALAAGSGLGLGFRHGLASTGELVGWTSAPTAVGMSAGYAARGLGFAGAADTTIAVARLGGLAVAAALITVAWWWSRRAGTVAAAVTGAAVAFAAAGWLGPVSFPWYALAPLALAAVATRDERLRAWVATAAAVLAFLILPNGAGLAARTKLPGALVVTAAVVAGSVWAARAVPRRPRATGWPGPRRTRRPDPPPVR